MHATRSKRSQRHRGFVLHGQRYQKRAHRTQIYLAAAGAWGAPGRACHKVKSITKASRFCLDRITEDLKSRSCSAPSGCRLRAACKLPRGSVVGRLSTDRSVFRSLVDRVSTRRTPAANWSRELEKRDGELTVPCARRHARLPFFRPAAIAPA